MLIKLGMENKITHSPTLDGKERGKLKGIYND